MIVRRFAAGCFVAGARSARTAAGWVMAAGAAAILVAATRALTLAQYFFAVDLGIDRLLARSCARASGATVS